MNWRYLGYRKKIQKKTEQKSCLNCKNGKAYNQDGSKGPDIFSEICMKCSRLSNWEEE